VMFITGRAVKVGPSAGVTKCVHEKVKICESPLVYLFDTPGILQPRFSTLTNGMKLAVCGKRHHQFPIQALLWCKPITILDPKNCKPITILDPKNFQILGNLPDSQVGEINIADFILFSLNKLGNCKYLEFTGLNEPSDCIATVLSSVATRLNFVSQCRSSQSKIY